MNTTAPKAFIFVLMPFSEDFEDVYQVGIKPACIDAGAYCERVDEQIFHESILERIYNQINKADLIVSDMTGKNPNVFYETGYAHALGKKVILLTQHADDIPFDLKHYPHIVYSGRIARLKEDLQHRVSWYLTQPDTVRVDAGTFDRVSFYIAGQMIEPEAQLKLTEKDVSLAPEKPGFINIHTSVSLHNPTSHTINCDFSVGFIFPEITTFDPPVFPYVSTTDETRLPDGKVLIQPSFMTSEIGPFCWLSARLYARFDRSDIEQDLRFPATMRIFHSSGIEDVLFEIELPNSLRK